MKHFLTFFICTILLTLGISSAQINWTKYPGNPVLEPGEPGDWDEYLSPFCILFHEDTCHMWYGGHGTNRRIGYAYSPDGINWTKYEGNPVLDIGSPGSWDDEQVIGPHVLFNSDTFHMWYWAKGNYEHYSIGYATSTDKVNWTKYENNPVLTTSLKFWESASVIYPCVHYDGTTYHMWYSGSNGDYVTIGYATSPDGVNWAKNKNNPVLVREPGKWDLGHVLDPTVLFDGNTFHMWYSGTAKYLNNREFQIGYAMSADGISWKKYDHNPILSPTEGEWDSKGVGYLAVIWDSTGQQFKMWYGGGEDNVVWKDGYATAPVTMDARFEYESTGLDCQFNDESIGIISDWLWNFDDGDSSTERNPIHRYESDGSYNVTLTISSSYGTDDTTMAISVVTGLEENTAETPEKFILFNNCPNPFNPTTKIKFQVPSSKFTTLKVYNILCKEIATLVSQNLKPGTYTYQFDGSHLASGIYYYQLVAGDYQEVKKMILIK